MIYRESHCSILASSRIYKKGSLLLISFFGLRIEISLGLILQMKIGTGKNYLAKTVAHFQIKDAVIKFKALSTFVVHSKSSDLKFSLLGIACCDGTLIQFNLIPITPKYLIILTIFKLRYLLKSLAPRCTGIAIYRF